MSVDGLPVAIFVKWRVPREALGAILPARIREIGRQGKGKSINGCCQKQHLAREKGKADDGEAGREGGGGRP